MTIILAVLVILALVFGPGLWVRRVLDRYSEPADRYALTGAALARRLLDSSGLEHVAVETTRDGDHYDPIAKAVRLMPERHGGRSLTAVTVAAHEVGHALQDKSGYAPLRIRTRLVRGTRHVERIGAAVLMASPFVGMLTRAPALSLIMFAAGFLTLASSAVVHLVTLPTELDASFRRALPLLERNKVLKPVDRPHARRLLKAAAFTYVAASLMSLLNIARWWAILRR